MWVKLSAISEGSTLFNFGTNLPNSLQLLSDGTMFFNADAGNFNSAAGSFPYDDEWHHLVVGLDGAKNAFFFVDGVAQTMAGNNVNGLNGGVNQDLNFPNINQTYNIDEFRIWETARSSTEINTNLGSELVGDEAGLLAYFNFNDGPGSATAQNQARSANGTLNNMDLNTSWVITAPF
ncbi:MAG: hypothetical protein ACI9GZ_004556 [Bacteroidia bacterium]|jgi:hypothetical protein